MSEGVASTATDHVTIIRSRRLLMAKRIHADGRTEPYGNAKIIDLFERPVGGFDDLAELVTKLLPQPHCAVVFGGIIDPARTRGVRRLAYPDKETDEQPTLQPVPHQWCALDMDGVDRPDGIPPADLDACAAHAVQRLPAAFQGVRCIAQASASHGIKPGCRLRLWFWLDRPTTGNELGFWLRGSPVDPCTFRAAQPVYTAAPVFVGRPDHLPGRLAMLSGGRAVAVPAPARLRAPERIPVPLFGPVASDDDVQAFIDGVLDRVRSAKDNDKHYTLRKCARLLGGIQTQAGFSDATIIDRLIDALPPSAIDLRAAAKTVEWGLASGRQRPIKVETHTDYGVPRSDPRRKETLRTCFRLLRAQLKGEALLSRLHTQNTERPDPIPSALVNELAFWACSQPRKATPHAR
jgi:hypothetical protein